MGKLDSGSHTGKNRATFTSWGIWEVPNADVNGLKQLLKKVLLFSNQFEPARCTRAYALASHQQQKSLACT